MFRKSTLKLAVLAALPLVLAGCGGENSSNQADLDQEVIETDNGEKRITRNLTGQVVIPDGVASAIDIEVISLDHMGNIVEHVKRNEKNVAQDNTALIMFEVPTKLALSGGKVIINISALGVLKDSKAYSYTDPENFEMNVTSHLDKALTATVHKGLFDADESETFSFSLTESNSVNPLGKEITDNHASLTSGLEFEFIRVDFLAADALAATSPLNVGLKTLNLHSEGKQNTSVPSQNVTRSGQAFSPLFFSYMSIVTAENEALDSVGLSTLAHITQHVPNDCSYDTILEDVAPEKEGLQVPVYTYNDKQGFWEQSATGDLHQRSDGAMVSDTSYQLGCHDDLVVKISADLAHFANNWWSLGLGPEAEAPLQVCANIEVVDSSGVPQSGRNVFLRSFDYTPKLDYGLTDSSGVVQLSLPQSALVSPPFFGQLNYWGAYSGLQQEVELFDSNSGCGDVQIVELEPGLSCSVSGVIEQPRSDNFPPLWSSVSLVAAGMTELTLHQSIKEDGSFNSPVACNTYYNVLVNLTDQDSAATYQATTFNVDGVVGDDELSDDARQVVLAPAKVENQGPMGLIVLDNGTLNMSFSDIEQNYPISYYFEVLDVNNAVVDTFSGELNQALKISTNELPVDMPFDLLRNLEQGKKYTIEGSISDIEANYGFVVGEIKL
ncbi:hypothetical protein [Motilimonas pumila]|uniref:Carboxypeptidase regulatory-like domain-containing protein n=1 Tax=Motilimonas pumila TaxID=2303987 RepID=A0A418YH08_9GAMM|nr:hypothetical protein [Motilimonas pumila]RJG49388.1 hypothetical protein D1Z90_05355 [Motilimonas pumila]